MNNTNTPPQPSPRTAWPSCGPTCPTCLTTPALTRRPTRPPASSFGTPSRGHGRGLGWGGWSGWWAGVGAGVGRPPRTVPCGFRPAPRFRAHARPPPFPSHPPPPLQYDSLQGYLFNIAALKTVFSPEFILHDVRQARGAWRAPSQRQGRAWSGWGAVTAGPSRGPPPSGPANARPAPANPRPCRHPRQTGPSTLTTRWTMTMAPALPLLPPGAGPALTFTGTSEMTVDAQGETAWVAGGGG